MASEYCHKFATDRCAQIISGYGTALVVKMPDCQEPEKSGILNILMTSENQVLTLYLLDRQKPAPLLFYSV